MSAPACPRCGGWGFTWAADDVPERCPTLCPLPTLDDTYTLPMPVGLPTPTPRKRRRAA